MRTDDHITDSKLFNYSMSAELFTSKGGSMGVRCSATGALHALQKPSVLQSRTYRRSSSSLLILKWMN